MPPTEEDSPPPARDAESLYADFLERREAGERLSVAELCAQHPDHAQTLHRLERAQREYAGAFDRARRSGSRRSGQARSTPPVTVQEGQIIGDFRLRRFIASGGMGQVWEAEQISLKRRVALKVVRPDVVSEHKLELFAREARAGARLDHPGIVRVHAYGRDEGLAWIATELVEGGWTLREFLEDVRLSDEPPFHYYQDVAGMVAEIADAMQVAHDAEVIHRDLKPQNILIASDNRLMIGDFGLARITDESALSITGEFLGTYFYMSPEQAMAGRMGIDHRTDVFSLGIVLYELLTLRRPFEGDTTHQVAAQIVTQDPPDPQAKRSRVPGDLSVICLKALEKDREKRFDSMAEFAADLRRHLGHEPILAKPPTAWSRARKWARRHPTKSVAAGVSLLAIGAISALLVANLRTKSKLERQGRELAAANRAPESKILEAPGVAARERKRADEVIRIAILGSYESLLEEAQQLWPPFPDKIADYQAWIRRARALVAELPRLREEYEELVAGLRPAPDARGQAVEAASSAASGPSQDSPQTESQRLHESLEASPAEQAVAEPDLVEVQHWAKQLKGLIGKLEELTDAQAGLLSEAPGASSAVHGWSMPRRLAFSQQLETELCEGGVHTRSWNAALPMIEEYYMGLQLPPQMGLVPLGRDPQSGLWEFAHLLSGQPPERGSDGELVLTEESCVVLVLLPDISAWMGAQSEEPGGLNYEYTTRPEEGPVHEVQLTPFFLSKYELTQSQFKRITGTNPSTYDDAHYFARYNSERAAWTGNHPVESVDWFTAVRALERVDLVLPSEAQWEFGARAGTSGAWWPGSEVVHLQGVANLADADALWGASWTWKSFDLTLRDGEVVHDEVWRRRANPFGLHDVHGNVSEWCLDEYQADFYDHGPVLDPVAATRSERLRVTRGGCFSDVPHLARSAARSPLRPEFGYEEVGIRPARAIRR